MRATIVEFPAWWCCAWLLLADPAAVRAADCSVGTVSTAFGIYDPLSPSPNDNGVGAVEVTCQYTGQNERVAYRVSLSRGIGGSYTPRQMASGGERLAYNLYQEASRVTIWGDGTGGSFPLNGQLPILNPGQRVRRATHSIYGRIPAVQDIAVGSYSDVVTVTVDW